MKKSVKMIAAVAAVFTILSSQTAVAVSAHTDPSNEVHYSSVDESSIVISKSVINMKVGETTSVKVKMDGVKSANLSKSAGIVTTTHSKVRNGTFVLTIRAVAPGTETITIRSNSNENVFDSVTVEIESTQPSFNSTYSYAYQWYSITTGKYYLTYNDALMASGGYENAVINGDMTSTSFSYTSEYQWYSVISDKYYKSYDAALLASGGVPGCVIQGDQNDYNVFYTKSYQWYSFATERYYRSYNAALIASRGNRDLVINGEPSIYGNNYNREWSNYSDYYSSDYTWFSSYTGKYYNSFGAALDASAGNPAYVTQGSSRGA